MQTAVIFDPFITLTPTQRIAAQARIAFRNRIAETAARKELWRRTPSVVEPEVSRILGYFPDPWIPEPRMRMDLRTIQLKVCDYYCISMSDMVSARKTVKLARPRQVAVYLAKKLTPKSLPQIGRDFGDRDHTTILAAVRRIEALIKTDEILAADVAKIESELVG